MIGPTARQQECLDFLTQYIAEHGYAPSMREIGTAMRIRTTNGVSECLEALRRKGCISRAPVGANGVRAISRSIVVLPAHAAAINAAPPAERAPTVNERLDRIEAALLAIVDRLERARAKTEVLR